MRPTAGARREQREPEQREPDRCERERARDGEKCRERGLQGWADGHPTRDDDRNTERDQDDGELHRVREHEYVREQPIEDRVADLG
jgi:hypothetical protein